jgi:hypothetical protein
LFNIKQTNSNSILSTAIPYSYCEPKLITYYAKCSKHIEGYRQAQAYWNMACRI